MGHRIYLALALSVTSWLASTPVIAAHTPSLYDRVGAAFGKARKLAVSDVPLQMKSPRHAANCVSQEAPATVFGRIAFLSDPANDPILGRTAYLNLYEARTGADDVTYTLVDRGDGELGTTDGAFVVRSYATSKGNLWIGAQAKGTKRDARLCYWEMP